jgi:hypothetical protein
MNIKIVLVSVALHLLLLGFFSSCAGFSNGAAMDRPSQDRVTIVEAAEELTFPLESYFAVASIYRGLFEPLSLDIKLSLDEKWEILSALYFQSPLLDEIAGGNLDEAPPGSLEISGFYETGDALKILFTRFPDPYRLEWMSNCIYSPIVKGPLLGRGEFIGNRGQVYNYGDTILLARGRPLRFVEVEDSRSYLDALVEKRSAEPGALLDTVSDVERLNAILILLEGGRMEDTEIVERYLNSLDQTIPVRLIKAEWALAAGNNSEAIRFLDEVKELPPETTEDSRRIIENFRDRYLLQQRLDDAQSE